MKRKIRRKRFKQLLGIGVVIMFLCSLPELFHTNEGMSRSIGSVRDGKLENAYLVPYMGKNFGYFSFTSYFLMNNGYTHSRVYHTLMDAYKACEETCPDTYFTIMECSDKGGGRLLFHWTHQNGTSADFMIPKKKKGKPNRFYNRIGLWHYLLKFTDEGKLSFDPAVELDLETAAKHILALHNAAKRYGLRIRKVILKVELQPLFFQTPTGRKIKAEGIYFVRALRDIVNVTHDDHYHVDFEFVGS